MCCCFVVESLLYVLLLVDIINKTAEYLIVSELFKQICVSTWTIPVS